MSDQAQALRILDALGSFIVVQVETAEDDVTAPDSPDWDEFLLRLLNVRLERPRVIYTLDEPGRNQFLRYVNRIRKVSIAEGFQFVWPQQLLKLAARLHVKAGGVETAVVPATRVVEGEALMQVVEGSHAEFHRHAAATGQEKAVRIMAEKVKKFEPITKRDLFRRYDCQDHQRLNPIVAECIRDGLIREDAGKLVTVAVSD